MFFIAYLILSTTLSCAAMSEQAFLEEAEEQSREFNRILLNQWRIRFEELHERCKELRDIIASHPHLAIPEEDEELAERMNLRHTLIMEWTTQVLKEGVPEEELQADFIDRSYNNKLSLKQMRVCYEHLVSQQKQTVQQEVSLTKSMKELVGMMLSDAETQGRLLTTLTEQYGVEGDSRSLKEHLESLQADCYTRLDQLTRARGFLGSRLRALTADTKDCHACCQLYRIDCSCPVSDINDKQQENIASGALSRAQEKNLQEKSSNWEEHQEFWEQERSSKERELQELIEHLAATRIVLRDDDTQTEKSLAHERELVKEKKTLLQQQAITLCAENFTVDTCTAEYALGIHHESIAADLSQGLLQEVLSTALSSSPFVLEPAADDELRHSLQQQASLLHVEKTIVTLLPILLNKLIRVQNQRAQICVHHQELLQQNYEQYEEHKGVFVARKKMLGTVLESLEKRLEECASLTAFFDERDAYINLTTDKLRNESPGLLKRVFGYAKSVFW